MKLRALIIAASFAIGGCSTLTDYGLVRKEGLRNDEGHLVGYKQLLRNEKTGEVFAQVALFTPLRDGAGELIGYEEQTRDGALIRDLNGRPIGSRFADLRSRNTNARSKGITIVFRPADAPQVAVTRPKVLDLMASLSASDLRRIQ
ncbi:MAG: hypothetical protein AB1452_08775 [Pseudomonadota bacterium]